MTCSPVLFLIFNRPGPTAQVFARIRAARPPRLYVAADGPRPDRPGEAERCAEVRRVATSVDWPCEVRTLFRADNLGCGRAVSAAISWFFGQEPEGIILEDDCLPDPTFFPFCTELLARYRDDPRVFMINGANFQFGRRRGPESYYFSRYPLIWGWAAWRRTWQLYDFEMKRWPELRETPWLREILHDRRAERYWRVIFDRMHSTPPKTWGFQMLFSCWAAGGLNLTPDRNLVSNIGFDQTATHTLDSHSRYASVPTMPMNFPLRHPGTIARNATADAYEQNTRITPSLVLRLARKLKRLGLGAWSGNKRRGAASC